MEIKIDLEQNDGNDWLSFKHYLGIKEGQKYNPKIKELFFKYRELSHEEIKEKTEAIIEVNTDVPFFNLIEYELYGERYKMDVSPLLTISNAGLESATDMEIDEHLEKIAAYRHSIATLKEAINLELVRASEAFESWQSRKWIEVSRIALSRRKQLKEETGSAAGWFGSVTKEELRGILMTEFKKDFNEIENKVLKYRMMDKVIGNLLKILEDRGSQVQTIIRRRQGLRREP